MFLYIFLLSLFDPERLHILKHESSEADEHHYFVAWFTAFLCFLTYGTGSLITGYLLYYPKKE